MEYYTKAEFIRACFRDCLKDGQPHSFKEIFDHVQREAAGTRYEGKIDSNTLGVYGTTYEFRETEQAQGMEGMNL